MFTPDAVKRLVDKFDQNKSQYLSPTYNEAQLRQEFLDPFFGALGWDIENRQGISELYKEVIHEDSIKIGGETKAPDYAFRIGKDRKFFVEAKKPAVSIKENPLSAFQLRRYAWTAKLPLSILTDFQEFAVYDTRISPSKTDKAAAARIQMIGYEDYIPKWEEIHSVFSREAVWHGSFDKYVIDTKGKKGTDTVDDAFLKEIESWRDLLARNIALRNPKLTVQELNFSVQRTIDRIIFLRICEDRGIESYASLRALLNGERIYKRMQELFHRADERYNSGLFHFRPEKARPEHPDELTLDLTIDDKPLKEIIGGLYYPDCPYEFSVLPADILGQVYEQFLGKVIRLTAGHQAKVEEKPEVKKAGGVYYTPTYIVDYIVKNTVGKLVEGKSPKQVSEIHVLDPACGSGSFLIGAYQYLLDWHATWYTTDGPEKWATGKNATLYRGPVGDWRLTTAERKRILLSNIYGVDIDSQAVEVTKLSLLLKVLEGENDQSISQQLKMFQERALPDLGGNIKCGNSLIGPDYFDGKLVVEQEERIRINAFDWNTEFTETMDTGGFDAVIGNPPYRGFTGFTESKSYLTRRFQTARAKFDMYVPFVELAVSLVAPLGLVGVICPTNFFKRDHGEALRKYLSTNTTLLEISDFEDVQIFDGALNYTGVFVLRNGAPIAGHCVAYRTRSLGNSTRPVPQDMLTAQAWIFQESESRMVVERVRSAETELLGDLVEGVSEGIVTGNNSVFLVTLEMVKSLHLEGRWLRPCYRGAEVRRYFLQPPQEHVIYPYELVDGKTEPVQEEELSQYDGVYNYLCSKKNDLKGRGYFDRSSKLWYELWNQRTLTSLESEKIVVAELSNHNRFAIANNREFYGNTVCGIVPRGNRGETIHFLLGILNSALLEFMFLKTSVPKANGFYIYNPMFLKRLPIRVINVKDRGQMAQRDRIVTLVKLMIELQDGSASASTSHERTALQRQIDITDKQIDALVYELYGLTEAEVAVVEGRGH